MPLVSQTAQSDAHIRKRIGPWEAEGLADLSDFEKDTNFVVRAAAGSGKTTSLVARMVALVRQGVEVDSMAAITFTRKAAGEMNERFFIELRQAREALEEGPAEELQRVETALRNLQHGFIGTVHSFCARILREYALTASIPPDFVTGIEARDERKLRDRALNDYLQQIYANESSRLAQIEELGVDLNRIPLFFQRLCRYPDLEPYTDGPDEPPELDEAVEAAVAKVREWQAARPDVLPKDKPGKLMKVLDKAEAFLAHVGVDAPPQQAEFLKLIDGTVNSDGQKCELQPTYWGKKSSDVGAIAYQIRDDELPELVCNTIRPVLRVWDAHVHRQLVELLLPAVDYFRDLRRERGDLTHGDLLYHTRELLRDNPSVRERLQKRYKHLLVDEFQDTDPLQAEILFYLTGSNTKETNWRRCTPHPGSLFIVGDDKQSIYRFRRADKAVFDEVSELVQGSGGELVDLTRNFRSIGKICTWCNEAFEHLFSEDELADIQAPYIPFQADRSNGRVEHAIRRISIDKVFRNSGVKIAKADAERIADIIRAAVDGDLPELNDAFDGDPSFGDFLILTRVKSRLDIYANALARLNIPYTVTGSQDLQESPELRTLLEILRCALRPDDPIAAVSYLKGGVCGFSDDDLYRLKQAGGSFRQMHRPLDQEVQDDLPVDLGSRFQKAFERISDARRMLNEHRPMWAIEQISVKAGLLPAAAHPADATQASQRAGQFLRAMSYIRHLSTEGIDCAEIVDELQRVVDGEEEIDGITLETGSDDAVRILNVHKAKGLQAPVVFLADPYSTGRSPQPISHVRRAEGEVVVLVEEGEGHFKSVAYGPEQWHEDTELAFATEEQRHSEAENRRLLYVAATRAQNMLVVSTYPEKPDDGYWHKLYPYLERHDVPELEAPSVEKREAKPAPAPELRTQARADRIQDISQRSYQSLTFTEDDYRTQEKRPLEGAEPGYGRKFGTALHDLFEMMVRFRNEIETIEDVPVEAFVRDVVPDETSTIPAARRMAQNFLKSNLWQVIAAANAVRTEYPIAQTTVADVPTIRNGVIDLLFRDNRGWHIVDFKSDRLGETSAEMYARQAGYEQQVHAYSSAWKDLSGEPIATKGLFFADTGAWVSL